jgi:hypothetical protein
MAKLVFELDVEMEDGHTFSVVADQRDVAKFEVQPFGFPWGDKVEEKMGMGTFRFLAWSAGTRQGLTSLPWADFDAQCVEALPPDDEEGESAPADDVEDPGLTVLSGTP